MSGGPLPDLLAHLRIVVRSSALSLAALLLAGAAPAVANSSAYSCSDFATCYFGEDLGTGSLPDVHDPRALRNSREAEREFLGVLGGRAETESFETFSEGEHDTLRIFLGRTLPLVGKLSDSVYSGGSVRAHLDHEPENRGFPTEGSQFWKNETTSNARDQLFSIEFSEQVHEFGFYATAWSTQSTRGATDLVLDLVFRGGASTPIDIRHDESGNLAGSVFYFAVASRRPFVGVALRNSSTSDPGDRIGFDEFTVAVAPEPSTGLLLSAGLLGLAAAGRRRSA